MLPGNQVERNAALSLLAPKRGLVHEAQHGELGQHLGNALLWGLAVGPAFDLGIQRRLIMVVDSGELLDLAGPALSWYASAGLTLPVRGGCDGIVGRTQCAGNGGTGCRQAL